MPARKSFDRKPIYSVSKTKETVFKKANVLDGSGTKSVYHGLPYVVMKTMALKAAANGCQKLLIKAVGFFDSEASANMVAGALNARSA